MSIRIEITDPASLSIAELHALSNMLLDLVDNKLEPIATGLDALRIAAEDSPAAGAPTPFPTLHDHTHIGKTESPETATRAIPRSEIDLALAAAAFGAPAVPNVAPGIAAAAAFSTAPAVPQAPISALTSAPSIPVPPPAPPAGIAAAPTASPAPGVELDVKGLPWDARIHSSGRAKIADGTWKMKRGTIPEVVARVEAELRQVMAIPGTPAAPAAPVWPFSPPVPNVPPAPTDSTIPAVPPAPSPVAIVTDPATASPSNMTFPDLVKKITSSKVAGTLTDEMIKIGLAAIGVPALPLLATRQDLIGKFASILDGLPI